ncbi:MAG: transposase [Vicinamibacterales bacterium]
MTTAAEELEAVAAVTGDHTAVIVEAVLDKGYHSNRTLLDLAALDIRAYIAEPRRGRRRWTRQPAARDVVYANRHRIRGARGRVLQRRRAERLERPNAHLYETGGMRRTHLRGHTNILKRLLIHAGGFNLGLFNAALHGRGNAAEPAGPRPATCGAPDHARHGSRRGEGDWETPCTRHADPTADSARAGVDRQRDCSHGLLGSDSGDSTDRPRSAH